MPPDTGTGYIYRPVADGAMGGRIATLESFFAFFINNVTNPDEAKALDPLIEYKIRLHPDVTGAMRKRELSVASMPWRINSNPDAPDKALGQQVASYVEGVLKNIKNFQQCIQQLQNAVIVGGQGIEFVWHREANGVEYPVSWWPVHMSRFLFDRLGNMSLLNKDNAVWGIYVSSDPSQQYNRILPRGKFVYHVYRQGQGTWENPQLEGYIYYGIGEDVPLFYVTTFDIFCLKFRMKFLERFGIPPTILYYPETRKMNAEVVTIADSLRGESVITIPMMMGGGTSTNKNSLYEVEQMPIPAASYDFFQAFSNDYTLPRVNTILLGAADESQQPEVGSYAGYIGRQDHGPNVIFKWDAMIISNTLTNQLIPPIVLGRYPNLPEKFWPSMLIAPKEEKDRLQELEIIGAAAQFIEIPKDHVYEAAEIPKPKIDPITGMMEETIGGQNNPLGLAGGMDPNMVAAMAQQQGVNGPGGAPPPNIPGLNNRGSQTLTGGQNMPVGANETTPVGFSSEHKSSNNNGQSRIQLFEP